MSGLDVDNITDAYDAVRSDKDEKNWLLLADTEPGSKKLALSKTGSGGLQELTAAFDDTQVQYAYVRVEYNNDAESKRIKFALITWIGEGTKVMRKARVIAESGEVKKILSHHSIAVTTGERKDLAEDELVKKLRKAGGADYNGGRG